MIVLSLAIALVALVAALPALSDLVSVLVRRPRRPAAPPATPPELLFLVPAHDEELLVAGTVASLLAMDYPADRRHVVVVADNCTDATADAARRAGARVLERVDPTLRGKPRALAWAVEQLRDLSYDALVVIDADSEVDRGFARAMAAAGPLRDRAAQGFNDVQNRAENALTRMSAVFSRVRTVHMNELKHQAGLTVPMMNGLCLGREIVDRWGWDAFSICEDWEMYVLLTQRGVPVANVPGARVCAQAARSLKQSSSQRIRWASGKIAVLVERVPALLRTPTVSWRQKLDVAAEMTTVGPAVLAGTVLVLGAVVLLLGLPGAPWLVAALLVPLVRLGIYTLMSVTADPEPLRAAAAFGYLPFYTAWRLGLQFVALRMVGNRSWTRTARHRTADLPPVNPTV